MKILRTNIENLENETLLLYKLTRGGKNSKGIAKLDDEELERDYHVDAYCQYEDANAKGEPVTLLSILTDAGLVINCQSATFQRSFFDIVELCKDNGFSIRVTDGQSKNGRRFMDCELVAVD